MISRKLNWRQAQWALYLLHFNFTLKHVLGKSIGKANKLSQRADQQKEIENNDEDRMLIKQKWVRKVEMLVEDRTLRERIKKTQEKDKKVVKAVEELKKAEIKNLRDKKWAIEKGIVIKKECIYIPEKDLRREIIHLYYNTLVEGYGGRWKTVELVTRNYW